MTQPEPDHVTMLQMSRTVPFRCPRCGYILHADPGATIPCPACFGQGYWSQQRNQTEPGPLKSGPESGPKSGPGPGSVIQFHGKDEGPESG